MKMIVYFFSRRRHRAWLGLAALAVGACGDGDGGAGGAAAAPPGGATYAVCGTVFGPDESASSYIALVPSLGAEQAIDYGRVLELGGENACFGLPGSSKLFVGRADAPTLTRFELEGDQIRSTGELSLGSFGLGGTWGFFGRVPFVSDTKAYFVDEATLSAITWNPTTMEATGSVDLSAIARPGWRARLGDDVARRGSELFMPAYHVDVENGTFLNEAVVAVLDTAADAVRVISDGRCGEVRNVVEAPNGDLYFGTSGMGAAKRRVTPAGLAEPCLLRVKAGDAGFDPDFYQPLAARTGGRPAGWLVPARGAFAYVQAYEEADGPVAADATWSDVASTAAWHWWRIELGSDAEGARVDALPPASSGTIVHRLGDRVLVTLSTADYAQSTLVEVGADGATTPGIVARGTVYTTFQVR